jgi:hypothetical protein
MTTYQCLLKTCRCCGVLFAKDSKQMLMIWHNLFYEKVLSHTTSLMGSFQLNLHIKGWLFKKSWLVVEKFAKGNHNQ